MFQQLETSEFRLRIGQHGNYIISPPPGAVEHITLIGIMKKAALEPLKHLLHVVRWQLKYQSRKYELLLRIFSSYQKNIIP